MSSDLSQIKPAYPPKQDENGIPLKQALADALARQGYDTLTPVQEAVTNPEFAGADLLVSAQTGSGKTVGFGLAIAPTVLGEAEAFNRAETPLALVITPTRELALQVKRELGWLYEPAQVRMASCVGGMDMRDERRALARGAHIVVATPGRLRDHIQRGSIDLSDVRAVVLDEADEMLDLGFREDLEFILEGAPKDRQTLLFSATVPKSITGLAKKYQRDAIRVSTVAEKKQHADIEYRAMTVAARDAENAIINVLRYFEAPNAIVFCNTRAMVNRVTARLSNRGFSVVALSGELSQSERTHALQAMRDGRARVCVATDVAARGIDLPNLDLVVHAELPNNHEILLHRSGRTGRAGRKGVSAIIIPPSMRHKSERMLKSARLNAEWGQAPTAEEVKARDLSRLLDDPQWLEPAAASEAQLATEIAAKFTAEQIAANYIRLWQSKHSAPEELSTVEAPRSKSDFGPSVWFSIEGGRRRKAEPRRLLPQICEAGGITKHDIGAIRIQDNASYVQILAIRVDEFLGSIGPAMNIEGAKIEQIDTPPPGLEAPPRYVKPDKFKPRGPKKPRHGTTKPVDWNDDPAPRTKKPKKAAAEPAKREETVRHEPREDRPKGPPPPKGKSNSKKNRARAKFAKETAKGAKKKGGGLQPPKRPK